MTASGFVLPSSATAALPPSPQSPSSSWCGGEEKGACSSTAAHRHNPGRGREGGDSLADAWAHLQHGLGAAAWGAKAVLLQHGNQLENLLLITQRQISHPAYDAIRNFRAVLRRGRKSCLRKGQYASSWHWSVFIPLTQRSHRAYILAVGKPHL